VTKAVVLEFFHLVLQKISLKRK